ncbi:MAG: hypothetical protein GJ680_12150 [Alteromonadaceae bacterium]|nr:hypothetical protein [Alteromonadaceae bacterium]
MKIEEDMQVDLEKLKKISAFMRYGVFLMVLIGVAWTLIGLVYSDAYREAYDSNLHMLWTEALESKAWLLTLCLPNFALFLLFSWYFQRLLKLFSHGEFFSADVVTKFKIMLWTKAFGLLTVWLQSTTFGYLVKKHTGIAELSLRIDLWEVFTLIVLFTVFYLLQGAQKIDQENKEFV